MNRFFTNLYTSILIFSVSNWGINTFFWATRSSHSLKATLLSLGIVTISLIILNYNYTANQGKFVNFRFKSLALLTFSDIISYITGIISLIGLSNWVQPFITPKSQTYLTALQALKFGWNPLYLISQYWSNLPRMSLTNQLSLSQFPALLNPGLFFNLLLIIASFGAGFLAIKKLLPRNLNFVNKYFWQITLTFLITCNPITIRLANSLEVIPQLYALYIIIIASGILISKKPKKIQVSNFIHWLTIALSVTLIAGISYYGFLVGLLLVGGIIFYHLLNESLTLKTRQILTLVPFVTIGLIINLNPYLPKIVTKLSRLNPIGISKLSDRLLGLINQQFNSIIPSISALTQSYREVIYHRLPFLIQDSEIATLKNPNLPLLTSSLGLWFSGIMTIWILGNGYLYWLTCLKPKKIGDVGLEDQMIIKFHHQRNIQIILIHTIFTIFLVFIGLLTRSIFDQNQLSFWWLLPCSSLIVWLYFDDTKLDIARQIMTVFLIGNCVLMAWLGLRF